MINKKPIATPSRTKEILNKYGLSAKKSLGQNFIIDSKIMEKIVKIAKLDKQTNVIEVGPGIGALTEFLAEVAQEVLSFEIDQRFISVLEQELGHYDNLKIVEADVLKVDLEETISEYFSHDNRLVLVANLPYYITTPILMHFLQADLDLDSLTVMIQKEVAERLTAPPSTKAYGSLSITVQYYMQTELAAVVPPSVFKPTPNVDSAIIYLEKHEKKPIEPVDEELFFKLVRQAFVLRRKTLRNNLIVALGKEEATKEKIDRAIEKAGLQPSIRGEALDLVAFERLTQAFYEEGVEGRNFLA